MENFSVATAASAVEREVYGGKAFWLSWLIKNKYPVPNAVFLPAIHLGYYTALKAYLEESHSFISLLNEFKYEDKFAVAIRSSAVNEDSTENSYAGHYKSFVGVFSLAEVYSGIEEVIKNVDVSYVGERMGVILQQKVNAKFSGVVFSSNPLNSSKNEVLISIAEGMGEALVSGKISGEDILISYNGASNTDIPLFTTPIEKEVLLRICSISKDIESKLGIPVDIEWCIDQESNKLILLQCRPITALFVRNPGIMPINLDHEQNIPHQVRYHDKINTRLLAQKNNIDISKAYLVLNNEDGLPFDWELLSQAQPEERCKGYSVVLLYPETIDGNIIRHFSEVECDRQSTAYRPCQRYNIRSYQDFSSLRKVIDAIHTKCKHHYWVSMVIIQEIFEPVFTGTTKRIDDGYLVEVAKGHFVPKGVVPTSQYVLNEEGELLFKSEIIQSLMYKIIQGTVTKQNIDDLISVDLTTLSNIINDLSPILKNGEDAIEFGLLKQKNSQVLTPYLIDLVNDGNKTGLNSKFLTEGVISLGKRGGRAVFIDAFQLGGNSLNLHFHDEHKNDNIIEEEIIFITVTPDIGLLELIKKYDSEKIGFIFMEGSALSHFSIILRERKIPAIVISDTRNIKPGDQIHIDAITPNMNNSERLTTKNSIVTTYTNPDTDGVVTSIAYAFYMQSKGETYVPVYWGTLDKETNFVLNLFNVPLPKQGTTASGFNKIVLVDTHHIAQLPKDIVPYSVLEIIDHHPGGDPDSFPNATIQNDAIGAACTIIAERMQSEGVNPDARIAGIMYLAIISNTLNLTAPSATQRDKNALVWLNSFTAITDDTITRMFDARSDISGTTSKGLIQSNIKEFQWGQAKVGIVQVEMTKTDEIIARVDFLEGLIQEKDKLNLDYILFTAVNIIRQTTTIVCPDKNTLGLINEAMGFNSKSRTFEVNGILLRKTDFIPALKNYFEK